MVKKVFVLALLATTLTLSVPTHAQSGGSYTVTWSSTNSGVASSGGPYTLNAMLSSQGTGTSSGGIYTLGGVWSGSPEKKPLAYLPLVLR